MRKILIASITSLISLNCNAQITMSASVGLDDTSIDCSETASPIGMNTILNCRKTRPSSALRLGYIFDSGFGVELTSFNFGRANAKTYNEAEKVRYDFAVGKDSYIYSEGRLKTHTLSLALSRSITLSKEINTVLKVGWAQGKSELTSCPAFRTAVSIDFCPMATAQRRRSLYVGASLNYKLSSSVSATLSMDYVPTGRVEIPGSTLAGYSSARATIATAGVQWTL